MDDVPSPCKRHGLPRCLYYDLTVRPRISCCVDGDVTALLWRPYSVHTVLSHGIYSEHV